MAHPAEPKAQKTSAFILASDDGEIQERIGALTMNEAKATARKLADTHKQSFVIFKAVAKTTFKQVARTERV